MGQDIHFHSAFCKIIFSQMQNQVILLYSIVYIYIPLIRVNDEVLEYNYLKILLGNQPNRQTIRNHSRNSYKDFLHISSTLIDESLSVRPVENITCICRTKKDERQGLFVDITRPFWALTINMSHITLVLGADSAIKKKGGPNQG